MAYTFGDPALVIPFTAFEDSVATDYGVPGLCALNYLIEPDYSNIGVTIDQSALTINVHTTNSALIGTV